MILIDSNIPMYLVGATHPHKIDAQRMLERHIAAGDRLVTDAEVFQEIMHRYVAIERRDAIQPAYDALLNLVDDVLPITRADVILAKEILFGALTGSSARDVLHVAVMRSHDIDQIMTFDRGFERFPGVRRIGS